MRVSGTCGRLGGARELASGRWVCYNNEARYGARGAGAAQAALGYFRKSFRIQKLWFLVVPDLCAGESAARLLIRLKSDSK
jgi:membrane peptidoglycan carboxypeptidase